MKKVSNAKPSFVDADICGCGADVRFVDRRKLEQDGAALLDRLGDSLDLRRSVESLKVSDQSGR